jgi:F-type H+-transporting ATPase subunit gamma
MPNTRLIKRRIRSVQSIGKVTKAMEMVAASRMRRTQERALAARPYDEKIRQVIADLSAAIPPQPEGAIHPLLESRPVQRVQILLITTDRGLCGALNGNVIRQASAFILEQQVPVSAVAVGRKGRDFLHRCGQEVRAEFSGLGDRPGILDISPIANVVIEDYGQGVADRVYLIYPRFMSTVTQHPVVQQLLPVEPAKFPVGQNVEYIFEPHPSYVLAQLLPRFVEMEIYHAILETIASEQSARMVAMRNATDNASELFKELTLAFNKARQEAITNELLDMIGAKVALE